MTLTLCQLSSLIDIYHMYKYHQDPTIRSWFIRKNVVLLRTDRQTDRPTNQQTNMTKNFDIALSDHVVWYNTMYCSYILYLGINVLRSPSLSWNLRLLLWLFVVVILLLLLFLLFVLLSLYTINNSNAPKMTQSTRTTIGSNKRNTNYKILIPKTTKAAISTKTNLFM